MTRTVFLVLLLLAPRLALGDELPSVAERFVAAFQAMYRVGGV